MPSSAPKCIPRPLRQPPIELWPYHIQQPSNPKAALAATLALDARMAEGCPFTTLCSSALPAGDIHVRWSSRDQTSVAAEAPSSAK